MKHSLLLGFALCWLLVLAQRSSAQQGLNNLWMGGYASSQGPPYGGVDLEFSSGTLELNSAFRAIWFFRTNANITDAAGDLLFSTNGAFLANAAGDTLLNGTGLNPSNYTSNYPEGLHLAQTALVLPKPSSPGIYFLVHCTLDDPLPFVAHSLYITTIDMSLDGGLGGVVTKNEVVLADTLNVGKITAVRHANGRDWWVLCHKANTNIFYRMLVTPNGISVEGTQAIGAIRPGDNGQTCFSPDGSKFAYYWGITELEIFQFDRCTGLLFDPQFITVEEASDVGMGVSFSPNSRFAYVSTLEDVYQYDTEAPDIAASMVHIAEWDGFYSPSPPFATLFDIAQLAPDGKIYIGTGNSTFHLHVINNPDEGGLACNMVQHGVELPRYFMNSLPNHPNYHLGPLAGSPCDTLGLTVEEVVEPTAISAFPNPSTGVFTLNYAPQRVVGELEVRDMAGRLVLRERLPQWSQVHRVVLDNAGAGLYQCQIRWGAKRGSVRVILER